MGAIRMRVQTVHISLLIQTGQLYQCRNKYKGYSTHILAVNNSLKLKNILMDLLITAFHFGVMWIIVMF